MGPAVEPSSNATDLEKTFREGAHYEVRPCVRTRFDQLSDSVIAKTEANPFRVDGEAFFITNGEPVYFWDFMRAVWHAMGDPLDRRVMKIPKSLGSVLASLAETWAWLTGKEPTFTRFRVAFSCVNRWHNIEKARLVLGYEPKVGVTEGVVRMVEVRVLRYFLKSFMKC